MTLKTRTISILEQQFFENVGMTGRTVEVKLKGWAQIFAVEVKLKGWVQIFDGETGEADPEERKPLRWIYYGIHLLVSYPNVENSASWINVFLRGDGPHLSINGPDDAEKFIALGLALKEGPIADKLKELYDEYPEMIRNYAKVGIGL